jgi:uncharacterized membrane protein
VVTAYVVLKFLHIVAAIVWVGGVITLGVLQARLALVADRAVQRAMARQSGFFGMAVAGPAALLTLVAGMGMLGVAKLGAPFWVGWGFASLILSIALGATLMRRTNQELSLGLEAAQPDEARLGLLQRRVLLLNTINILLLLSSVGMMVFKPVLA